MKPQQGYWRQARRWLSGIFWAASIICFLQPAHAELLLYEGFDVSPESELHGQAGLTSFGFHPVFGATWDKGIYGSPKVGLGSLVAPSSTLAFYHANSVGNRVIEDSQSTTIGRTANVSAPLLYGTFLASMNLDGFYPTRSTADFTNFRVYADNAGNNSTQAFWFVQTSGGVFNSGVSAQGETLISWELEFNTTNSLAPDRLSVWFNSNPLTNVASVERTTDDFGQFDLGGINLKNDIFLGLSTAQFDEFRIGTDWSSVGIGAVPEPSSFCLALAGIAFAVTRRVRLTASSSARRPAFY